MEMEIQHLPPLQTGCLLYRSCSSRRDLSFGVLGGWFGGSRVEAIFLQIVHIKCGVGSRDSGKVLSSMGVFSGCSGAGFRLELAELGIPISRLFSQLGLKTCRTNGYIKIAENLRKDCTGDW